MAEFRNKSSWYFGLSAYWFATSFKWYILLLVVLPGQVEKIVPGGEKSQAWGMVFAIGATWAAIGPSLFGYLSDRLLHRWGDRRPFIAIGSALTVIALMVLLGADQLWVLVLGYLLLQVSDDIGTGPYSALIPELVPEENRGRASGTMGLLTLVAQLAVGVFALVVGGDITLIYGAIAVVNVLCALLVLWTIRGAKPLSARAAPVKASVAGFVKGWIEPWKSRDFFWVWFTRFLNAFGFYLVLNYLKFYLGDVVGVRSHPGAEPVFDLLGQTITGSGMATNILALVLSTFGAIGSVVASKYADRSRKKVIYASGTLMFFTLVPFVIFPNFSLIFFLAMAFGVGYGMYLSADWALVSDVLPNKGDEGKDMGVWQMSTSVVQIFTGAAGSLVAYGNSLGAGRGYQMSFALASVAFLLSTVLVRKVRGSR